MPYWIAQKLITPKKARPVLAIGGIERCVLSLSRALYNKGLDVRVFNATQKTTVYQGIIWSPINQPTDFQADIVIACNDACLFDTYGRNSGHKNFQPFLWLHNPVHVWKTIRKGRFAAIIHWRPTAIFLGTTQRNTTSQLIPFRRETIIEHGIEDIILTHTVSHQPPPPHAAFISQSYRGLDDVIRIWKNDIHPLLPDAKLDVYCEYKNAQDVKKFGIHIKGRLPRQDLLNKLSTKRLMFIPGHSDETYCLAAAESLCLGIPIITYGYGSLKERVIHEETGYIADTEKEFADNAVKILTDDVLWLNQHIAALSTRSGADWNTRADEWVSLWNIKK